MLIELCAGVQPQTSLLWHWLAAHARPVSLGHISRHGLRLEGLLEDSMKNRPTSLCSLLNLTQHFARSCWQHLFFYSLIDICFFFYFFYSERSERTSIARLSLSTCCMHSIRPVTTCSQQMEIRLADKPLTRAFRGHVSFKLPFYFHRYLNLPTSTVETISE